MSGESLHLQGDSAALKVERMLISCYSSLHGTNFPGHVEGSCKGAGPWFLPSAQRIPVWHLDGLFLELLTPGCSWWFCQCPSDSGPAPGRASSARLYWSEVLEPPTRSGVRRVRTGLPQQGTAVRLGREGTGGSVWVMVLLCSLMGFPPVKLFE